MLEAWRTTILSTSTRRLAMKTIKNLTPRPVAVPLPLGKKLHLGPHQTGQVAVNAIDHAPLQALIEAATIEVVGDGRAPHPGPGGHSPGVHEAPAGGHGEVSSHHRGER
jgi:hypothetical protein